MEKNLVKVLRMNFTEGDFPTKAYFDLLIKETFVVKNFRIVEGANGLFASMPHKQDKDGNWYDIFFPIDSEVYKNLQELLIKEYETRKKEQNQP